MKKHMKRQNNRLHPSSSRGGMLPIIQNILEKNCQNGFKTLQIGSSTGFMTQELEAHFKDLKTVTLDINPDVVSDITNGLPFKNNSFDLCFSSGVIEHEPIDYIKAISESVRVADTSIHFIPN
ncbi:MAG: methyltransferase domain-containing protein, partial [Candidatus Aenigmatarchaeota archaeon]